MGGPDSQRWEGCTKKNGDRDSPAAREHDIKARKAGQKGWLGVATMASAPGSHVNETRSDEEDEAIDFEIHHELPDITQKRT
jgi:hypothetical protein